ncbi:MAG TPA: gliding motility-associated C-terminal domain-containing protein [Mucilaginibacter sp.]|nr:gliding motility-associated C-terminal domain-containing protein [Mucilaginibacter sp.]
MVKHILKPYLLVLFLLILPFIGICQQSATPIWVNDIGGPGDSKATGMASDPQNNIYVTGYFSGTVDFDPSPGVRNLTSVGGYDVYVAKYAPDGTLIWATSMGGDALDQVNYLTVDNNGNVTITGQYQSSTLTAGTTVLQSLGDEDAFIIHLDASGTVAWAKTFGSSGSDRGEEINADAQGNLIATAIFQGTVNVGATPVTAMGGGYNALIIKYDIGGNLLWDIRLGDVSGDTQVFGDGIDASGNIIVAGTFTGNVDFDPLGAHHIVNSASGPGFVAKYTPAGKLIWVNTVSGNFVNSQAVVGIDASDNIFITGAFSSSLTFGPALTLTSTGSQDTFLAKYLSNGTFQFAKDIGGSGANSFPYQIRNDKNNNVYISGYFSGTIDFNPATNASAPVSDHGQRDFYVAKYDASGNYQWAFGGGSAGCNNTFGIELAVDNNNDVILSGSFCQTVDFDPSACVANNVTAQNFLTDTYIVKYLQVSALPSTITTFSIPQQISPTIIDETNHTITVTVAAGTNVTALVPTIAVSNSGVLAPASGIAQNFTNPVIYNLTSGCVATPYTIKVILAAPPKPVTTCSGAPNIITGDVITPAPTGYAWQVLQSGVWVNAPGVINGKDYQTSALINNGNANIVFNLRRQVTAAGNTIYDSYYDVTVQSSIAISGNVTTAPAAISFCVTGDPGIITGSTATGGNGTYTYKWQSSADNVTFTDIAGATAKDYDPPVANTTIYYRRIVTSGTCVVPSTSNVITISVLPVVANDVITAPAVTAFCSNGNPANIVGSTPTGGDGTYIYQWQSSADNVTFSNIAGAVAKDYDPPLTSANIYFRRTVISGACTTPLISNVVSITLSSPATNNTISYTISCVQPSDLATITGSVPVSGSAFTYQWQNSTEGINFTNIAGETSKDYNPVALPATIYYRRMVITGACADPSNQIKITQLTPIANDAVTPPAITAFCLNGDPGIIVGSTPTGGDGNYTYKWQSSLNNVGFDDIPGANSKDFDPPVVTQDIYYRRMILSSNCITPSVSNTIHITILQNIANNTITVPTVIAFCSTGNPAVITGSTPSGGDGAYIYKWQSSVDNITFNDIPGAASKDFDPAVINATTYYRRIVSSAACGAPLTSNVISIIIATTPATPVFVTSPVTICTGNAATLTVASPQQGVTYDWYDSPAKTNHLFTGNPYITSALSANTTFYVQATNGSCSSPLAIAQVNITGSPAVPLVNTPVAVCTGSSATLNISNPQAGLIYNWYTTATGGNPVFTGINFMTLAIIANTIYYAEAVNNGGCVSVSRAAVNVTVNPLPQVTAQGTSICPGTTATLTASSTDQNAVINWYASSTGGNIIFTGSPFTTNALNANTTYYAEAVNTVSGCVSTSRSPAAIQMIQAIDAPVVTVSATTTSSVTFKWSAVNGATGYQVSIDNGQTFTDPSSGSAGLTHTVSGLQLLQSVTVVVRATGSSSCQLSTGSVAATGTAANPLGDQIFVPNAFTPNGDGKNDIVYVRGGTIKSLKFYVYDQWGELLYTSLNQQSGWDGTYKGTKEPVGVYVYYVEAIMNDGHQVNKKGTITLLK